MEGYGMTLGYELLRMVLTVAVFVTVMPFLVLARWLLIGLATVAWWRK
jgi:hypothetical protein